MSRGESKTLQALWVAIGSFSTFAISIMSAAILSRFFNKADYGTYKQILYVYSTLLIVFSAGLPRVFAYFLPRYSIDEGKAIVWKISKLLFLAGFVFSLCLFSCSNLIANLLGNEKLEYALKSFSPVPFLLLPTLGIEGIFSTYKKANFIAYYNFLSRLLTLLFIVAPVIVFDGDYILAIHGWVIASALSLVLAMLFKSIPFKDTKSVTTNLSTKEVLKYSVPLVFASLWGVAIKAADQFYISRYFGPDVFAEFSNGFIELPLVGMVTASASVVLMPIFSKALQNEKELDNVIQIWKDTITKSATILYPILVFFFYYATEIMGLLYSDLYYSSSSYFRINMILNFFNIIIFAPLILALGETKFYAKMHMYIAFVAWGGGYIVVHFFHSPHAVAVFSVSLAVVKVLIAIKFICNKLKIKLIELFPVKLLLTTVAHTSVICAIVGCFLSEIIVIAYTPVKLLISLFLYIAIILVTSKAIKISYTAALSPVLNKVLNVKKV